MGRTDIRSDTQNQRYVPLSNTIETVSEENFEHNWSKSCCFQIWLVTCCDLFVFFFIRLRYTLRIPIKRLVLEFICDQQLILPVHCFETRKCVIKGFEYSMWVIIKYVLGALKCMTMVHHNVQQQHWVSHPKCKIWASFLSFYFSSVRRCYCEFPTWHAINTHKYRSWDKKLLFPF